ncbi:MAG TPA: hypothetical protein PK079_06930 [Leptospiraceae bacterium]|nr:hypothetical protein [Leptospiraceae bacterium]HMW05991.1 hypothetical protein [Leptospiraceae bacterium]HMX32077.1 hypothetical protein [Leptospiraceae bacterium]HMY32345.1 hypothetical protein [Leptospiraceae bacterium]HMZ62453.1 hypothetical protein [Leptospiraceae bacterium]
MKSIFLIFLFLIACTPDGPTYIPESDARARLYLLTILKCSSSGGDPRAKSLDIFSFVEKQFKTNTLAESDRKKVIYYKKDYQKCETLISILPIDKCDFKGIDLINLASKGGICKLEPASYYNF